MTANHLPTSARILCHFSATYSTTHSLRTQQWTLYISSSFFSVCGCLLQRGDERCLTKCLQAARLKTAEKMNQMNLVAVILSDQCGLRCFNFTFKYRLSSAQLGTLMKKWHRIEWFCGTIYKSKITILMCNQPTCTGLLGGKCGYRPIKSQGQFSNGSLKKCQHWFL